MKSLTKDKIIVWVGCIGIFLMLVDLLLNSILLEVVYGLMLLFALIFAIITSISRIRKPKEKWA